MHRLVGIRHSRSGLEGQLMLKNLNNHQYDDIINLPNPTSKTHLRMPLYNRAAQFSPFAALTGHDAAVKETARLTEEKQELSEDEMARLNEKLNIMVKNIGTEKMVTITYFVPDHRKSGGAYISCSGIVKRVDEHEHTIVLTDKTVIPIAQISRIQGEMFGDTGLYD